MKPTCGPLPCVTTTFHPDSIMPAMSAASAQTISYWSMIDSCVRSRINALPPIATTARRLVTGSAFQRLRKRTDRLREASERRVRNTRADLADAGLLVRDSRVDHRKDAGIDDVARVDPRRRAAEIQRRQRERVVAA